MSSILQKIRKNALKNSNKLSINRLNVKINSSTETIYANPQQPIPLPYKETEHYSNNETIRRKSPESFPDFNGVTGPKSESVPEFNEEPQRCSSNEATHRKSSESIPSFSEKQQCLSSNEVTGPKSESVPEFNEEPQRCSSNEATHRKSSESILSFNEEQQFLSSNEAIDLQYPESPTPLPHAEKYSGIQISKTNLAKLKNYQQIFDFDKHCEEKLLMRPDPMSERGFLMNPDCDHDYSPVLTDESLDVEIEQNVPDVLTIKNKNSRYCNSNESRLIDHGSLASHSLSDFNTEKSPPSTPEPHYDCFDNIKDKIFRFHISNYDDQSNDKGDCHLDDSKQPKEISITVDDEIVGGKLQKFLKQYNFQSFLNNNSDETIYDEEESTEKYEDAENEEPQRKIYDREFLLEVNRQKFSKQSSFWYISNSRVIMDIINLRFNLFRFY